MSKIDKKKKVLIGLRIQWQKTKYKDINKLNIILLNMFVSIVKIIKQRREQRV